MKYLLFTFLITYFLLLSLLSPRVFFRRLQPLPLGEHFAVAIEAKMRLLKTRNKRDVTV